jgi:hypothetical protein
MATLERRVQVLFDPAQYAALEAEAAAHKQSVAAIIRESVDDRLRARKASRHEAIERLLASADRSGPPLDWDEEKKSFEHDHLHDL